MDTRQSSAPLVVYISHWFPKASETFIFYEMEGLFARGVPVSACSLYGLRTGNLSPRMLQSPVPVERLGFPAVWRVLAAVARALRRDRKNATAILRDIFLRRWRTLELRLENAWAGLCGFYLAEQFRQREVGHVHAAWGNGPATAAWIIRRLAGIPFSISVHSIDVRPSDGVLADKLAAASFARADSSCNMPVLAALEPGTDKHHLIYTARTLSPAKPAAVRMERPIRLLCVGRFLQLKGFHYAVEALSLLASRGVDADLTLAGSGLWGYFLKRLARRLGVADKVHFPGFVAHDRMSELMRASDILLMPSIVRPGSGRSDSLPTVIVEAMLHGLPVIGSNIASFGDVIRHGETGLLAPERDAPALASAIESLARDRENALRMAASGRELVMAMFDPDANLGRLTELFTRYAGPART